MIPQVNLFESSPPQLVFQRSFDDLETLAADLGWNQEFRQLEPGDLDAQLTTLGNEACLATRVRFNRSFHQVGSPPEGFWTVGLPDSNVEVVRIKGIDLKPAPLVNFNCAGGLDMVSHGPFEGVMFSFPPSLLKATAKLLRMDLDLESRFSEAGYWSFQESEVVQIRELIDSVFNFADGEAEADFLREHQEAFDFEFAALILQIIAESTEHQEESVSSRQQVLDRALKALRNDESRNMTVAQLCTKSFASLSTLNRAFMDEFGVSPKVYMRAHRLAGAQRALINASPGDKITDIGNDWGFWHMGMFASDYKKQFGELPSATLQRAWARNSK